jgi:hypothetical protein
VVAYFDGSLGLDLALGEAERYLLGGAGAAGGLPGRS